MRLFALGLILGLVFGSVASSSAAYINTETWQRASNGDLFHLGYVAGAIDTVEALRGVSFLTRQTLAEFMDSVERCTASVSLGDLTTRAESAVDVSQPDANAADAILAALAKCQ